MTTPICEHCGSVYVVFVDRPDGVSIRCEVCGIVEWIWKDNEYEEPIDNCDRCDRPEAECKCDDWCET
jgi:hypothetical protein